MGSFGASPSLDGHAWWLCTIGFSVLVSMSRIWANLPTQTQYDTKLLLKILISTAGICNLKSGWNAPSCRQKSSMLIPREKKTQHHKSWYNDTWHDMMCTCVHENTVSSCRFPRETVGWSVFFDPQDISCAPSMDQDIRVATDWRCEMHVPEKKVSLFALQMEPWFNSGLYVLGSWNQ